MLIISHFPIKEQELRPERMQLLFFILSYFNTAPRFALVTMRA